MICLKSAKTLRNFWVFTHCVSHPWFRDLQTPFRKGLPTEESVKTDLFATSINTESLHVLEPVLRAVDTAMDTGRRGSSPLPRSDLGMDTAGRGCPAVFWFP